MRLSFWLNRLTSAFRSRSRTQTPRSLRRQAPREVATLAELLETRTLLSAINWDGGAGTFNWGDADNWSTDTLPGPADDVTIPDLTGTPTITSSGTVAIQSLTANEALAFTGGSISVLQPAVLNAGLTQSGGGVFFSGTSLSNSSTITVASGSTLDVTGLPTNGLVGLWHAEGNANDAADVNIGSLVGSVAFTAGQAGQAFNLGGNGYVAVADSAALRPAQFTLDAWIYPTSLVSGNYTTIVTHGGAAGSVAMDNSYFLGFDPTGHLTLATFHTGQSAGGDSFLFSPSVVSLNAWHHVAGSFDGSARCLYLDGVEVASGTSSSPIRYDAGVPLTIGEDIDNGAPAGIKFRGSIDEVSLYSRALSATEIASLMNGGAYTQTSGTTTVNGSLVASTVTVSGGTLNGSGTITSGLTNNGGIVAPGNSPGIITVNGNYSQSSSGALSIEVGGTTVGTQYDQLAVNGTVTLGGDLILTGINSFTPTAGNTFVILKNDGTDLVTNTFNALPDGAAISNFLGSGLPAIITYFANSDGGSVGNDVALTVLGTPTLSAVLDASNNLTITDTDSSGKNNALTVTTSGTNLVISDANERFFAAPAGGTLSNGDRTLTIPFSAFNSLTINGAAGTDTVNLNGDITFAAGSTLSVTTEILSVGAGADLTTSGAGTITLTSDSMNFSATSTLVSAASVTLKQQTNNQAINLGGADSAGTLGLTDTELDRITAPTLVIGNANSGAMSFSATIDRSASTNFTLDGTSVDLGNALFNLAGGTLSVVNGAGASGTLVSNKGTLDRKSVV